MHSLLRKLLDKRGLKDTHELKPEEKQTYDDWQRILSTGEISVQKIKDFCHNQVMMIQGQWKNLDNDQRKNDRLITMHTVYTTLLNVIESPNKERESLERFLTQLVEEKQKV